MTNNLRASLLMVITMAGFSVEDLLIKQLSSSVPVGQILILFGFGGAVFYGVLSLVLRQPVWSAELISRPVILRNGAEMVSTMTGLTALTLLPLSLVSSILQAAPILVTIGAALVLGEKVGWRRWSAILVGIVGVILILRPGTDAFNPAVWLSVIAVVALAARDLATRATSTRISTLQLAFWGYALTIPSGLILHAVLGQPMTWPAPGDWAKLAGAQLLGIVFYYTLTLALRIGEASVVVPFRYSRLVFALALGVLVLGESVDALMLVGLALVTASGLYTLLREARRRSGERASPAPAAPL